METMRDFVQQIKARYDIGSDNQLALKLGIKRQSISQHKKGRTKHFSEKVAYRIAELLRLNPTYVLLCLAVERAPDKPIRAAWRTIVDKVDKYAAGLAIIALMSHTLDVSARVLDISNTYTLHIMSNVRTWLLGLLLRFGGIFSTLSQHRFCNVPG